MSEAKPEAVTPPPVCIPNPFSELTSKTDLVLLVEDQRLYVNRAVMSIASPVFEAMLEGDFKDKGLSEIPLPDKKHKDMLQFFMCMYPSVNKSISKENLDGVLPLADEYQVLPLKERCEAYVLVRFENQNESFREPPNQELLHYLYLADTYKLTTLLNVCIGKMKYRTLYVGGGSISTFSEYTLLSCNTKNKLIMAILKLVEKSAQAIKGNYEQSNRSYNDSDVARLQHLFRKQ